MVAGVSTSEPEGVDEAGSSSAEDGGSSTEAAVSEAVVVVGGSMEVPVAGRREAIETPLK